MKIIHWLMIAIFLIHQQVPTNTPALPGPESQTFSVRYEPSPFLVIGDVVSIEVTAPPNIDLADHTLYLSIVYPIFEDLGSTTFSPGGDRPYRARFPLGWETEQLQPGTYVLQFSIHPVQIAWKEIVTIHAPNPNQLVQHWVTFEVDCCNIYYIIGTRAERDIHELARVAQEQVKQASNTMKTVLPEPVNIVFLPRVIGHGGFAGEELYISYPDVNYTNIDLAVVLHHEIIHRLDRELGGSYRPAILVEGLAVYLSEGHYKQEDLVARSAALLSLGGYIPLAALADDFYPSQHESGYMLAGALVEYMVATYGWDAYSNFYRDIQPPAGRSDSVVIDDALQRHFNMTFAALEEAFIAFLQAQPIDTDVQDEVRLTIELYDTLRQYQQHLDPAAYFRNVWIFPNSEVRDRGIVTNWTRWPLYPQNQIIERLLESAGQDLWAGKYVETRASLAIIQSMLENIPALEELPYLPAFSPLEVK
jgi:hypothetical protein